MDERYARHIRLAGFGVEGQERLVRARVLCVGAGGLGSPVAMYLAAAGVGVLGLVDGDVVDRSNLQRQLLHGESDVGRKKVESARDRLREINPLVEVVVHDERLNAENARRVGSGYDVIVDGADNFPTRYLVNDLAYFLGIPCVSGAVQQFEGQCGVFAPHLGGPCYRCLFPEPPQPGSVPSCEEAGVLGVLPGIIGSLQAMEVIKFLTGVGEVPLGKLQSYDALRSRFREVLVRADPQCALCGERPSITDLVDYEGFCELPARETMERISAEELRRLVTENLSLAVLDVRTLEEWEAGHLPGARHVPMQEIEARLDEIPADRPLYVHCKAGVRSAMVIQYLQGLGYEGLVNVDGQVV